MKGALNHLLKSFFGGFCGCLGALASIVVIVLVISLVFGQQILGGISGLAQSLQGAFGQVLPSIGEQPSTGTSPNSPLPSMKIYLTLGDNPDGKHITAFTVAQTKQVHFWVEGPKESSVAFTLQLTSPDKKQFQFGPEFRSDPSGKAVECGQFSDSPAPGNYVMEVFARGYNEPSARVEFKVNK